METVATIHKLLYVPFNHDYSVDAKIEQLLTENEFFEKCFLKPDFEKEINELIEMSDDEVKAFEIDLTKDELIERYERQKLEEEALYNWINSNQNDIYCIKGDAGAGKSTFLHYLKYKYRDSDIQWSIIDLQKANKRISILQYAINIPHFNNLYFKAISAIISNISQMLFIKNSEGRILIDDSSDILLSIMANYVEIFNDYFPSEEIGDFFETLKNNADNKKNNNRWCLDSAKLIAEYFKKLLEESKLLPKQILFVCVELYIYLLYCQNDKVRHMIAFDNFERFIGTDEIYSGQLTNFVEEMRNIQNSISNNYPNLANVFQIIVFMRNTSTRMFTNQQIAELFYHYVDLSEWFQTANIIEKKVKWYKENEIELQDIDRLLDILRDVGGSKNKFRGLRSKFNMLFNNDKRVIINILTKVLNKSVNQGYIRAYDFFRENRKHINPSYARFAKRIIIFRLVLNELRNDDFFKHIMAQKNNNEKTSLGYARKILTILYDYRLQNDDVYMNFEDIIRKLYSHKSNPVKKYFDGENDEKRLDIAQVLYYMNYYDGRSDNWLQFIDIQYNMSNQNSVRVKDYEELSTIIDNNYNEINIRITKAGMAYLFYVVYTFEFFSCKSKNAKNKIREFGSSDIPPILCAIPQVKEIKCKNVDELLCIKIMKIIFDEVSGCIEVMENDENNIMFKERNDTSPIYHRNRIINSHTGFIDNYIYCMREIYKEELGTDEYFRDKFEELTSSMEKIRDKYKTYA